MECVTQTHLPHDIYTTQYTGKVRDMYFTTHPQYGDISILISTDRQSAFDRVLGAVPHKGHILASASVWWFHKTRHIINNHCIAHPDPNVIIAKKCRVLPIEFVVRGYISGTTNTSLWTHYKNGIRSYCGVDFPDGLRKNDKLAQNILTPTTKESEHDRPIAPDDIIAEGWLTQDAWDVTSAKALELFAYGQEICLQNGLILVDTKYEFGVDEDGKIILIDEIHTPDSSRFWLADSYESRIAQGLEPQNIDKEFFRLWFAENCDPYNDITLPTPPQSLTQELSDRYIQQYEMITGQDFVPSPSSMDINTRITYAITDFLRG